MTRFADAQTALAFVNGGNATFTLKSEKTGAHFTYKAKAKKDGSVTFLSLLNGPNNEEDYAYIGLLRDNAVLHTWKSKVTPGAPSIKALSWALDRMKAGQIPASLGVYHEGRCGRCQRKLTTPESIERGFGPECIHHVM